MMDRRLGIVLLVIGALSLWLAWRSHRSGVVVVQFGGIEYRLARDERPRLYVLAIALYVLVGAALVVVGVAALAGLTAAVQHG